MGLRRWLAQRLPALWLQRGPISTALLPISALYGALLQLRRLIYHLGWLRTHRLPVPVVVVGNVVAGGAGKTPTVLALLRHLQLSDVRVGVLSRGWGRTNTDPLLVRPDSDASQVGDEPLLLHRASGVPVAVGRDRHAAGTLLLRQHPDVQLLLCDDGLQHLALARDLELCVFDARGLGNGRLLPAGPLREPWPRPVDLTLLTEDTAATWPGVHDAFRARRVLTNFAVDARGQQVPLAEMVASTKPCVALAGIARPDAFFAMLRAVGVPLQETVALPDHYDFDSLPRSLHADARLICTEKDAVKLWHLRPDALAVALRLELSTAFCTAFDRHVQRLMRTTPRL